MCERQQMFIRIRIEYILKTLMSVFFSLVFLGLVSAFADIAAALVLFVAVLAEDHTHDLLALLERPFLLVAFADRAAVRVEFVAILAEHFTDRATFGLFLHVIRWCLVACACRAVEFVQHVAVLAKDRANHAAVVLGHRVSLSCSKISKN